DVTFYIFNNVVMRGSVNRVVGRLLQLDDKVGDFGILLYCGKDWADPQLGRKSMELMAEKVMPARQRSACKVHGGGMTPPLEITKRKGGSRVAQISRGQAV